MEGFVECYLDARVSCVQNDQSLGYGKDLNSHYGYSESNTQFNV